MILKFKGSGEKLINEDAKGKEKKFYTQDEALTVMFNDLKECVKDNLCLADEAFTHFKRNMRIIVFSKDDYKMTSRVLRGLIRGLLGLADDYLHKGDKPIRTLHKQTEDVFFFLLEKLMDEPAKERIRALFDVAKDYYFSLFASYGELLSTRFFATMYDSLLEKGSKAPHLNFWNAVPDRWNYSDPTEWEINGTIASINGEAKTSNAIYRKPDAFNLCAYYALCLLDYDKDNSEATKFLKTFKQYSEAVHRTTNVFPNNLSLNFITVNNDIEKRKHLAPDRTKNIEDKPDNRRFFAPNGSKDIDTKTAKKILLSIANDETQSSLARYFCYEKVEQIAPAIEAARISKKKRELAKNAKDIRVYRYESDYEAKGMQTMRGLSFCLLTTAICSIAFVLFVLWWTSELSNGAKAFWGGTPGFIIGIFAVLGIILWGPWGQKVDLVYVIGPGTSGPYFHY